MLIPYLLFPVLLQLQSCVCAEVGSNGKKEITEKGIEYVWESPPTKASKILFLAHGCSHSAKDFWPSNPKCSDCIGLPVERQLVSMALAQGYFVIAISSAAQETDGCWDIKHDSRRIMRVLTLLKKEKRGLRDLPVFALGASSGGHIVAALATRLPDLAGMCIQIAAPDIGFQMNQMVFPPSQWIYMKKDVGTGTKVNTMVDALKRSGALAESILAKQVAITKTFFSDRIIGVSPVVSEAIYDSFNSNDVITAAGYLREDPRHSNWRNVLQPMSTLLQSDSLIADKSPIAEVLNVAYALHEMTAEHMDKTLEFFGKAAEIYDSRAHSHEHRRA